MRRRVREFRHGSINLRERVTQGGQQSAIVRLDVGEAIAVEPAQQPHQMRSRIRSRNRRDLRAAFRWFESWKIKVGLFLRQKSDQLILQLEKRDVFFGVGDLKHELLARPSSQPEVLIALARQG